ncbi:MAG: bacillithiol system redox-active protein YtxJ [Bacteroidia bacterium]|nr:bacillithiol system redox-active protein YtxJ [Bacteroidia bacterium]
MSWKPLKSLTQLSEIHASSYTKPQLIFKHSIRCGVSLHVLDTIESQKVVLSAKMDMYYLDLLEFRAVSNQIASEWGVHHQSPQAILLYNGKVIYHASHYSIKADEILKISSAV